MLCVTLCRSGQAGRSEGPRGDCSQSVWAGSLRFDSCEGTCSALFMTWTWTREYGSGTARTESPACHGVTESCQLCSAKEAKKRFLPGEPPWFLPPPASQGQSVGQHPTVPNGHHAQGATALGAMR